MTGKRRYNLLFSSFILRAPQLHLSDDRMTIKGEKGYSMVRGTHGVRKGDWYYEIELLSLPTSNDSTVRVGFAQACADVQCPLGKNFMTSNDLK